MARSAVARLWESAIEGGRRTYDEVPSKYKEDVTYFLKQDHYEELITEN